MDRLVNCILFKMQSEKLVDEEDIEIYQFGLECILLKLIHIISYLLIGICMGDVFSLLVSGSILIPLRRKTGGYHAKTRVRCFFVSILCYLLSFGMMKGLLFLPEIAQNILITIGVATAFIHFAKFAPVENPNKRIREEMKEQNKIMSFAMLVVWYLVCSVFVFAGTYEISTQIWATIDIIALLLCVKRRKRK